MNKYFFFLFVWLVNTAPLIADSFKAKLIILPTQDAPDTVIRAEARASNSSATLIAGNLQFPNFVDTQNETTLPQSQPVFWVKQNQEYELFNLDNVIGSNYIGFYTISAISRADGQAWLVGRAWRNETQLVEGFAYNYISGELVWSGTVGTPADNPIAARFTGVSDDGSIFAGQARVLTNAETGESALQPAIYDRRTEDGLQALPLPSETYFGGWLYSLMGSPGNQDNSEELVGVGWVSRYEESIERAVSDPVKWDETNGFTLLEKPENQTTGSTILKISDDKSTGLGYTIAVDAFQQPALWDISTGSLTVLPMPESSNYVGGEAQAIAPNGSDILTSLIWSEDPNDPDASIQFRLIVYVSGINTVSGNEYILNNYGIDFGDKIIRSMNWAPGGGSLFGNYEDTNGTILPYAITVRPRVAGFNFIEPMAGGDYYAEARDISNDGSKIVGISSGYAYGAISAFWTETSAWSHFDIKPNSTFTPFFLTASDLSPDGRYAVGRNPSDLGTPQAWVADNETVTYIPRLNSDSNSLSRATGVSDDGTVVVGQATIADGSSRQALVYKEGNSNTLPYPIGSASSWAYALSGDGALAAGWAQEASGKSTPLLWNITENNYTELPIPPGALGADVLALNGPGTIAGGGAYYQIGDVIRGRPVYWKLNEQPITPTLVPSLPNGFEYGSVWSISDDGSLIAGQMLPLDLLDAKAFLFNEISGTRTIHEYMLQESGAYLDPTFQPSILRVSSNGEWFAGSGPDPLNTIGEIAYRLKAPSGDPKDTFGEESTSVGSTTFVESWFGLVDSDPAKYPVVFHKDHGWVELKAWSAEGGYFYDLALGLWFFADSTRYPILQRSIPGGGSQWLLYEEGSANPRRFYDYATQQWLTEDQL